MLYDLALDPSTGDVALPFVNTLQTPMVFNGADKVRQQINLTLLTFLGEWFLDTTFGVPYFTAIMVKNPSGTQIRSILRAKIMDVPDVTSITQLDIAMNNAARSLTVKFGVMADLPIEALPGSLSSLPVAVWGQSVWGGSIWGPDKTVTAPAGSGPGTWDSSNWDQTTWG